MTYLRSNWKLTKNQMPVSGADVNILESLLVKFRTSYQIDSASIVFTASMNGYGAPAWVIIEMASAHDTHIRFSANISGSLINVKLIGTFCMASLAATVTYPIHITGLISSR